MILDIPDSNPLEKPSYLVSRYDRGENRNNDSDRLLNVAISRARIKFILISNESFLNRHAKEGTSLQALLGKTYVEEMKMKKRMKALINAINLEIGEKTKAGLFGKKGDKTKLTSGSKTAWKMRKEFWNDGGEKAMYISSCFFKTSFIPTLLRNIRKANDENISIHYDKTRFKLNEKEISLFKAVYPEEMQYPFSMTFTVSECIYGAFHSVQEKVDGETIPFIVLKKYTYCCFVEKEKDKYPDYVLCHRENYNPFIPPSPNSQHGSRRAGLISFHPFSFRLIRFPLGNGDFETLVTNLSNDELGFTEFKALYHMRWGIETSFRQLKYDDCASFMHSRKKNVAIGEMILSMVFHNICTMVLMLLAEKAHQYSAHHALLYRISYSDLASTLRLFISGRSPTITIDKIVRELLITLQPVRNGRSFIRVIVNHPFVPFIYRAA